METEVKLNGNALISDNSSNLMNDTISKSNETSKITDSPFGKINSFISPSTSIQENRVKTYNEPLVPSGLVDNKLPIANQTKNAEEDVLYNKTNNVEKEDYITVNKNEGNSKKTKKVSFLNCNGNENNNTGKINNQYKSAAIEGSLTTTLLETTTVTNDETLDDVIAANINGVPCSKCKVVTYQKQNPIQTPAITSLTYDDKFVQYIKDLILRDIRKEFSEGKFGNRLQPVVEAEPKLSISQYVTPYIGNNGYYAQEEDSLIKENSQEVLNDQQQTPNSKIASPNKNNRPPISRENKTNYQINMEEPQTPKATMNGAMIQGKVNCITKKIGASDKTTVIDNNEKESNFNIGIGNNSNSGILNKTATDKPEDTQDNLNSSQSKLSLDMGNCTNFTTTFDDMSIDKRSNITAIKSGESEINLSNNHSVCNRSVIKMQDKKHINSDDLSSNENTKSNMSMKIQPNNENIDSEYQKLPSILDNTQSPKLFEKSEEVKDNILKNNIEKQPFMNLTNKNNQTSTQNGEKGQGGSGSLSFSSIHSVTNLGISYGVDSYGSDVLLSTKRIPQQYRNQQTHTNLTSNSRMSQSKLLPLSAVNSSSLNNNISEENSHQSNQNSTSKQINSVKINNMSPGHSGQDMAIEQLSTINKEQFTQTYDRSLSSNTNQNSINTNSTVPLTIPPKKKIEIISLKKIEKIIEEKVAAQFIKAQESLMYQTVIENKIRSLENTLSQINRSLESPQFYSLMSCNSGRNQNSLYNKNLKNSYNERIYESSSPIVETRNEDLIQVDKLNDNKQKNVYGKDSVMILNLKEDNQNKKRFSLHLNDSNSFSNEQENKRITDEQKENKRYDNITDQIAQLQKRLSHSSSIYQ